MARDVIVRTLAPSARAIEVVVFDPTGSTETERMAMDRGRDRNADEWTATVPEGTVYGLVAHGDGPRFDPTKVLVDPWAHEVVLPPGFNRHAAARAGQSNSGRAPVARARVAPPVHAQRRSTRAPIVYETHVRGMTARRGGPLAGTFLGLVGELDRLAALGVSVIELLPVHQNDPDEGSYWGYMPLVFGAVHAQYAATADANRELATLVEAAHDRDIEVWVDVVFNHTTEIDSTGPTYNLRGLSDGDYYRLHDDGSYVETTGCGNDVDTSSPVARELIAGTLDRLADLGIDGFRFDLAPVVSRHRPFVGQLDEWAEHRGVRMVAEPWDAVGTYELGKAWPGRGWLQWNDRFRDQVRGFLRAEPDSVAAMIQRVQGSPDILDAPMHSVNLLTCHDGFTMFDLVAYDRKHNAANGHRNTDGSSDNHSWNCGWEGDDDTPVEVVALRRRQLRNAWCVLAMSHGVPMMAMGDEFGRTQGGNNNAYNQDNETSWVDWERRQLYAGLERFVSELLALRHRHPAFSRDAWWGDDVQFFGTNGSADTRRESRSLAWSVDDVYVIANAWWEPLDFSIQRPGPWRQVVDTSCEPPDDIRPLFGALDGSEGDVAEERPLLDADAVITVDARSVVILERRP